MEFLCNIRGFWAAILLFFALPAQASTVVGVSEAELLSRSAVVGFGTVLNTTPYTNERGQVFTRAQVQVHEAVKGLQVGQVITVEVPGGTAANGLVAHSTGVPGLVPGQMLFGFWVASSDAKIFRPLGLSYGQLKVRQDGRGRLYAKRDTTDLQVLNRSLSDAEEPLAALVARLRRQVRP